MGYKINAYPTTTLRVSKRTEGETLEQKIERILENNEPIKDGAPIIFTERAEGVKAGYNIRTDRFEVALEAADKIAKSITAKRESNGKVIDINKGNDGGAEPTQGTENK